MAEATHGASGGGPDYNTDDDVWVNRIIKQLVLNAALSALDASKLCCKAWDIFFRPASAVGIADPDEGLRQHWRPHGSAEHLQFRRVPPGGASRLVCVVEIVLLFPFCELFSTNTK